MERQITQTADFCSITDGRDDIRYSRAVLTVSVVITIFNLLMLRPGWIGRFLDIRPAVLYE